MTPDAVVKFQHYIFRWFHAHGRLELPWRQSADPYQVLVSEIMLQQTQVDRVIPKYLAFLRQFPTVGHLADAPLSEVLTAWQGLGYNRRAKFLQQCAQTVTRVYSGVFPNELAQLQELPGIGTYTAAAVRNFAFAYATPLIETNVRTVYLHHFFPSETAVPDSHLIRMVEDTMDTQYPREWFWALMDYGSYLKRNLGNQNHRSKQYTKQSRFAGSLRQVRGEIIRVLSQRSPQTTQALTSNLQGNQTHFADALAQLLAENLIVLTDSGYTLAT